MMVAYEIHTFRDGAWKIDSVFDDKDLAVLEAQRVERSHRYSAVRVVEETFDEVTDRTVTRTIYRSSKVAEKVGAEGAEQQKQGSAAAVAPTPVAPAKARQSFTHLAVVAVLTLAAIIFSSLGALYALNSLVR